MAGRTWPITDPAEGGCPITGSAPPVPAKASRGPLPLRARVAAGLGRTIGSLSRATGRGSGGTLPGRVALLLAPDLLRQLASGRTVLLVSGTNGKTTTTRYLTAALQSAGPVLTNTGGANLVGGLASALIAGQQIPGAPAVLEVDEIALPGAMRALHPEVVALLNLSRDQLDRTGEVALHVTRWTAALTESSGTMVVANADDPLVTSAVLAARPDARNVVWVGAGQPWRQDCPRCPRCGEAWAELQAGWACSSCEFARPRVSWQVRGDQLLTPGEDPITADLALPGRANIANAAMAAAAASCAGFAVRDGLGPIRAVTDVDGRYLEAMRGGCRVRLLLSKNPAGWSEVLAQLAETTGPVVIAVNARSADGTDPSWLWDVPFEKLRGRRVAVSGERAADVSVRLLYAEVEHTVEPDAMRAVDSLGVPACDIAANYTAFTRIRARLHQPA